MIDADTGSDLSGPIRGTLPPGYLNQFRVNPRSPTLRRLRGRARALRRNLDVVIHEADHRLTLPVIGSNVNRIRVPQPGEWQSFGQYTAGMVRRAPKLPAIFSAPGVVG